MASVNRKPKLSLKLVAVLAVFFPIFLFEFASFAIGTQEDRAHKSEETVKKRDAADTRNWFISPGYSSVAAKLWRDVYEETLEKTASPFAAVTSANEAVRNTYGR